MAKCGSTIRFAVGDVPVGDTPIFTTKILLLVSTADRLNVSVDLE
jgi:hypothetical protein